MKNCLLFSKNLMEREEISLIGDLKDESNDNKITKVISVLPKEEGGEGKFMGDINLLQSVKNWIFTIKKIYYDNKGGNASNSTGEEIEWVIERDGSCKQKLDSLYTSITNKINEKNRKNFMNQYDVLYLTTERIFILKIIRSL